MSKTIGTRHCAGKMCCYFLHEILRFHNVPTPCQVMVSLCLPSHPNFLSSSLSSVYPTVTVYQLSYHHHHNGMAWPRKIVPFLALSSGKLNDKRENELQKIIQKKLKYTFGTIDNKKYNLIIYVFYFCVIYYSTGRSSMSSNSLSAIETGLGTKITQAFVPTSWLS